MRGRGQYEAELAVGGRSVVAQDDQSITGGTYAHLCLVISNSLGSLQEILGNVYNSPFFQAVTPPFPNSKCLHVALSIQVQVAQIKQHNLDQYFSMFCVLTLTSFHLSYLASVNLKGL